MKLFLKLSLLFIGNIAISSSSYGGCLPAPEWNLKGKAQVISVHQIVGTQAVTGSPGCWMTVRLNKKEVSAFSSEIKLCGTKTKKSIRVKIHKECCDPGGLPCHAHWIDKQGKMHPVEVPLILETL